MIKRKRSAYSVKEKEHPRGGRHVKMFCRDYQSNQRKNRKPRKKFERQKWGRITANSS